MTSLKRVFPLTLIASAVLMTTGVANALAINADNSPYTENIEATDSSLSLALTGGKIQNESVVIKGGTFSMDQKSSIETGLLDLYLNVSGAPEFNGTIKADKFIYRGKAGSHLDVALNDTVIETDLLHIIGTKVETGLAVTNSATLAGVKEIIVQSEGIKGPRTALTFKGNIDYKGTVTLQKDGFSGSNSRLAVEGNYHATVANVISKSNKTEIQSNYGGEITVGNILVEKGQLYLIPWGGDATFNFNTITVADKAKLQVQSDTGSSYGKAHIKGEHLTINLGKDATADFAGLGHKQWTSEKIWVDSKSLTVNIADASGDNTHVYLPGTDAHTEVGAITVIADGKNNTGDAQADLDKIANVVQHNKKIDGKNQQTNIAGVELVQKADGILDGAHGVSGTDGTAVDVVVDEKEDGNDTVYGLSEMAMVGLYVWRNEIDDMNKRLGELRDSKGQTNGIWTRVYTGRAEFGVKDVTNDYTAFQFGYDRQVSDGVFIGGAFSYTDGDNDFANGGGDSSLFAFTGYASWVNDNGFFLDVTGKVGRMKNEFDISMTDYISSAVYKTNAVSVSAEAGLRLNLTNLIYVEPQVAMMWGHVDDVTYHTSNEITVKQDSAEALIGRAGFVLGLNCPNNRGNAYVRASVLHDWKGKTDFSFTHGDAYRTMSEDLGGTWYEYGIGANFTVTPQTHVYADLEAADGGEVDTDYRVNIGVRYSF